MYNSDSISHLDQKLREASSSLENERSNREKNGHEVTRLQGLLGESQNAASRQLAAAEQDKVGSPVLFRPKVG